VSIYGSKVNHWFRRYAAIAPHNPLGPISLAAGIQLAASIPNFLCQQQVSLGEDAERTRRGGYDRVQQRVSEGKSQRGKWQGAGSSD
jgi:L-alanine-DL-glutamate epimerase-like enolase superfamily enzyme